MTFALSHCVGHTAHFIGLGAMAPVCLANRRFTLKIDAEESNLTLIHLFCPDLPWKRRVRARIPENDVFCAREKAIVDFNYARRHEGTVYSGYSFEISPRRIAFRSLVNRSRVEMCSAVASICSCLCRNTFRPPRSHQRSQAFPHAPANVA